MSTAIAVPTRSWESSRNFLANIPLTKEYENAPLPNVYNTLKFNRYVSISYSKKHLEHFMVVTIIQNP